jgi:uncharacterized membrane protein
MPNLNHLTHGISNLISLITKTKLGLSITARGSFMHKTTEEGEALLD